MTTAKDVLKMIKDNDVKYVDFRFTDPRGKWQHVTFDMTHDRRGHLRRRPDVRRLLDRRLEGDQRVRHEPDAGSGDRLHRSVLRRDHAVDRLRRARADHRRALQPRPARHRQEGRGPCQVDRRRRHRSSSAPRPSSSCSTTCASRPTPTTPASSSTRSNCRPTPTPTTKAATSATASAPRGGYFPVPPLELGAGHARRDARRDGARWASRSRSTTTRWPRPSTSSA